MSLDVTFIRRKKIVCPHCGNVTGYRDVDKEDSGGGYWY